MLTRVEALEIGMIHNQLEQLDRLLRDWCEVYDVQANANVVWSRDSKAPAAGGIPFQPWEKSAFRAGIEAIRAGYAARLKELGVDG